MTGEQLGEHVESWRLSGGKLTHMQMAVAACVSVPTASKFCKGESIPDVLQLLRLEKLRPGLVALIIGG